MVIAQAPVQTTAPSEPPVVSRTASRPFGLIGRVDSHLGISPSQKRAVDDVIRGHEQRISDLRAAKLPARDKRARIRAEVSSMAQDLKPLLAGCQAHRLDLDMESLTAFCEPPRNELIKHIAVSGGDFLPTGGVARSIFGSAQPGYGVSFLGGEGPVGTMSSFGYSVDELTLYDNGNDFLVGAAQIDYIWAEPIARKLSVYEEISAGPAYMDYSYTLPSGQHFDAMRLGYDASVGAGLRWDRLVFSAGYRQLSEPTGINFSGLEFSLSWTVVRF